MVLTAARQAPPPAMQGSEPFAGSQVSLLLVPPWQTPIAGAPGTGYAQSSGSRVGSQAEGIGDRLSGLLFCVNPVKPLSSPSNPGDPFGFWNGPKVRWCGW